jgi:hypothetical protein
LPKLPLSVGQPAIGVSDVEHYDPPFAAVSKHAARRYALTMIGALQRPWRISMRSMLEAEDRSG